MSEPVTVLQEPAEVPDVPLDWLLDWRPWEAVMAGAVYARNPVRPSLDVQWVEIRVDHHHYTARRGYRQRVVHRRVNRILEAGFAVRQIHYCPIAKGPRLEDLCRWCSRDLARRIARISLIEDMEAEQ